MAKLWSNPHVINQVCKGNEFLGKQVLNNEYHKIMSYGPIADK